jgi:hypothetical protein
MKSARTLVGSFMLGILLTLGSSAVKGSRLEVQDWDCPPAPQSCARPVVVGGFPRPYISDFHGISVVGDASLISAMLGDDLFRPTAFWLDVALYTLLTVAIRAGLARVRRSRAGYSRT